MADGCLFCKIVAGEIPAEIVYTNEAVVAFRDINPQAPTHILVIPRKHVPKVDEAKPEDEALLGQLLLASSEIARSEGLDKTGYRFVLNNGEGAGQTVWHIHLHLLGGRPMTWPPG